MTTDRHGDQGHPHSDAGHAHEHGKLRSVPPGMEPAVFAGRADVVFAPRASAGEARGLVEAFMRGLSEALTAAGCVLVGHVKGTLDAGRQGSLSFSLTSLHGDARVSATLYAQVIAAVLTVNVIVFGVSMLVVRDAVLDAWSASVDTATQWR